MKASFSASENSGWPHREAVCFAAQNSARQARPRGRRRVSVLPVFCGAAALLLLLTLPASQAVASQAVASQTLNPTTRISAAGTPTAARTAAARAVGQVKAKWPGGGKVPSPVVLPKLDGTAVQSNSQAAVDFSYAAYGFVKVRLMSPVSNTIKLYIIHGGTKYLYDLKNTGAAECYPLQMGNGSYTVTVYSCVSGNSYAQIFTATANVQLKNTNIVYQVPSQYVNYTSSSRAVRIAQSLVRGKSNNYARISAVLSYVAKNISYDYHLAKTVKTGYLPNVDSVLARRKGICFDYAAVSAAMLRSLGYPCRLVIGDVKSNGGYLYHAWNEVYLSGRGWITVLSAKVNTANWSRVDVTFISGAHGSASISRFVGNGSNYKKEYVY